MSLDEREQLERALGGDEEAFVGLYRLRQGPVYRFVMQMTGNIEIAEDVTQEVFLALLNGTARYEEGKGSLSGFLYGVARNMVLRRLEVHRTRKQGVETPDSELEQHPDPDETLLDGMSRRETVERVRRAVLSLPSPYRETIVLCDLGEASYEDAATAMECPIGTVRSRLSRGRALLMDKLSGYKGELGEARVGVAGVSAAK